ncbi:MAG: CYTH domain-containing protein [Candidatus Woesebacteria bacterium]|jgi:adenylate cyclase class IV
MSAPDSENKFECEVRFLIKDIKPILKKLQKLGASKILDYEFDDYYYQPVCKSWNLIEKTLRIRQWLEPARPTVVYITKNEVIEIEGLKFKRSLYEQGKVVLLKGRLDFCKEVLTDMGFELNFVVHKRKGQVWQVKEDDSEVILEYVENFGWTGELEFEGIDPFETKEKIQKTLQILGLDEHSVTHKPMSALFKEKNYKIFENN